METAFKIAGSIALLIVYFMISCRDVPIRGGHGDKPIGPKPRPTPRSK